jgi:hypothetical protein
LQTLDSVGGLTAYGSFIALGLVVVWAALLIPLCLNRLRTRAFSAASAVLAFLIVFFWLWPTITEISIGKLGSIKTNVEQARVYLSQLKTIEGEVGSIKARIEADANSAQELQKETAKIRADFEQAQAAREPRHITSEQEAAIINRLKPIPKGPVAVMAALIDSTDAKSFSEQISDTLVKSGFTLIKSPKDYLSFSVPGAFMMVRDIYNVPSYAIEIQNAFKDEAGILLTGFSKPEDISDNDIVVIAVSSHPP